MQHHPLASFIRIIAIFSLMACSKGHASILSLTYKTGASGTLDGVRFDETAVVITATIDTDDRMVIPVNRGWTVNHLSTSISILGVGDFDFITELRTFTTGGVILSRASGPDLGMGPVTGASGWDLLTPIGPITSSKRVNQWRDPLDPVITTGGRLIFDNDGGSGPDSTFTAVIVPEPSSNILVSLALVVGLFGSRRRS